MVITRNRLVTSAALVALFALAPRPAQADWLITPFVGANTGGDTVRARPDFGLSAAWMGAGIIGWEFDAGWTPGFFDTGADDKNTLINKSSLATYMVNVILGAPVGGQKGPGARPYLSAGLGAIHTMQQSDLGLVDQSKTDFAWNVGGGAAGFFSDNVGLRGDVRFFQNAKNELKDVALLPDEGRFGFWRITAGVVFRFGGQ